MSSKYQSYRQIRSITEQPISDRRQLAIGREGKVVPRRFHLAEKALKSLRAEYAETKVVPNPFNQRGNYHFIFATLVEFGLNVTVKWAEFTARLRQKMSAASTVKDGRTAWEDFKNKESRNDETGLDASDRIEQNVRVLQRLGGMTPCGLRMLEVGTKVLRTKGLVIDLLKSDEGGVLIRLNGDSNSPINELRVRQPKKAKRVVKRKAKAKTTETSPAEVATV
jgi:hypothetical protein